MCLKKVHTVFCSGCTSLDCHQECTRIFFFSTPSPALVISCLFGYTIVTDVSGYLIEILIFLFLMISDVEHHLLMLPGGDLYVLFWKNIWSVPLLNINKIFFLLLFELFIHIIWILNSQRGLFQDGELEVYALISSCESTKISTSFWTTIDRRALESTKKKKDTPYTNTKKKPQQYGKRGEIMIKSNPISVGWATHKLEINNTKVLLLSWTFLSPRSGIPVWGSGKGTGKTKEI